MRFQLANLLGLLGLLALIGLILIYILKPQYEDRRVSSTYVWKLSLKYRKRKMPWEWPLKSLLIILQVLIIGMIAFLMARPEVFATEKSGETIVILDASSSMLSWHDGTRSTGELPKGATRFDTAKDRVQAIANATTPDYKITVILANETPVEVIRRTDSAAEVERALAPLTCSYGTADMNAAIVLANSVLIENPDAEVVIVSDKGEEGFPGSQNVTIENVRKANEWNVAVLDFSTRIKEGYYDFKATVGHFEGKATGSGNYVVKLTVRGTNGANQSGDMQFEQEVTLNDNEPLDVSFWEVQTAGVKDTNKMVLRYEWAQVTIESKSGASYKDGYPYDDQCYLFGGKQEKFKVQIVTPMKAPNFLLSVFASLKNCTIDMPTMDEFTNEIQYFTVGYDLYVFDRYMPSRAPEDGSVWYIGFEMPPPGTGLAYQPAKTNVALNADGSKGWTLQATDADNVTVDILMKNIDLTNVHITRYTPVSADSIAASSLDYTVLGRCEGDPVILAAGKLNGTKTIITLFDLQMSDFPAKFFDFPAFVYNIAKFAVPPVVDQYTYQIGDYVKISPRTNTTGIKFSYYTNILDASTVTGPEKFEEKDFPLTPIQVTVPGIHNIVLYAGEREQMIESVYVRLNPEESNLSDAGKAIIIENSDTPPIQVEIITDLFIYFAVALLIFLILEWWVQYREQF